MSVEERCAKTPTVLTLGTATPGGGFPLYGDTVAAVINETDPTLRVETRNTKGSTKNVPLLEAGNWTWPSSRGR